MPLHISTKMLSRAKARVHVPRRLVSLHCLALPAWEQLPYFCFESLQCKNSPPKISLYHASDFFFSIPATFLILTDSWPNSVVLHTWVLETEKMSSNWTSRMLEWHHLYTDSFYAWHVFDSFGKAFLGFLICYRSGPSIRSNPNAFMSVVSLVSCSTYATSRAEIISKCRPHNWFYFYALDILAIDYHCIRMMRFEGSQRILQPDDANTARSFRLCLKRYTSYKRLHSALASCVTSEWWSGSRSSRLYRRSLIPCPRKICRSINMCFSSPLFITVVDSLGHRTVKVPKFWLSNEQVIVLRLHLLLSIII